MIQAPPDTVAPTTTISCNNAACATTPYVATVSVALTPTDTGGSGVDKTYYTTDGSTPTTSSTVYSAPFTLNTPGNTTVQFFSTDKAGNAETVQSQQVTVAPVTTRVSLTFDNGTVGQYTFGYLQALKPHGAHATFFVNSGTVGASGNTMTWAQLTTLAGDGNDIGGKTVSSTNLTTDPDPTSQVCNDRAALVQHGLDPVAFAYPGGVSNQAVKDIVKGCGYGVARSRRLAVPDRPDVRRDAAAERLVRHARLRAQRPGHAGEHGGPGQRCGLARWWLEPDRDHPGLLADRRPGRLRDLLDRGRLGRAERPQRLPGLDAARRSVRRGPRRGGRATMT